MSIEAQQMSTYFYRCQAEFEEATAEKLRCQHEAETTAKTIELANRLVGGLASENVRWAESIANFRENEKTLPGDVLLTTAFVSYVGCFTKVRVQIKQQFDHVFGVYSFFMWFLACLVFMWFWCVQFSFMWFWCV